MPDLTYTRGGCRVDRPGADALYAVSKAPALRVLRQRKPDLVMDQGSKFYLSSEYPAFYELLEPITNSGEFHRTYDVMYYLETYGDFDLTHEPLQSQFDSKQQQQQRIALH